MKKAGFWLGLVLFGMSWGATAVANTYGPYGFTSVYWPTPESGWDGVPGTQQPREPIREITPPPTNTQIWFSIHYPGHREILLLDAGGQPVDIEIRDMFPPSVFEGHWNATVSVKPVNNLEPRTTYTVVLELGPREPNQKWTFTTGDGSYLAAPPAAENLTYLAVKRDSYWYTGELIADTTYLAHIDKPPQPQPFFYELFLRFGEEHGNTSRSISSWLFADDGHHTLQSLSLGANQHPCISVRVEDIVGRSVVSGEVCMPSGCLAQDQWPDILGAERNEIYRMAQDCAEFDASVEEELDSETNPETNTAETPGHDEDSSNRDKNSSGCAVTSQNPSGKNGWWVLLCVAAGIIQRHTRLKRTGGAGTCGGVLREVS